jgi:hypothetical protein
MSQATIELPGIGLPKVAAGRSLAADPVDQVDRIVRRVLGELAASRRPGAGSRSPGQVVAPIADPLISLRVVEAIGPETEVIRIGEGAVVTPLALDALKRRQIEVIRVLPDELFPAGRSGEWGFAIRSTLGALAPLRRGWREAQAPWQELGPELDILASWVDEAGNRAAFLISQEPEADVWRASRWPNVRAAIVSEPTDIHRAVRTLGPNLLAVEPTGKSLSWIRRLATVFRRSGAPRVPESLLGIGNGS